MLAAVRTIPFGTEAGLASVSIWEMSELASLSAGVSVSLILSQYCALHFLSALLLCCFISFNLSRAMTHDFFFFLIEMIHD
jgi:hypothetical protein